MKIDAIFSSDLKRSRDTGLPSLLSLPGFISRWPAPGASSLAACIANSSIYATGSNIEIINGTPFNVVENYMTSNPGTAGVTVNGNSYSLNQGTPVLVSGNYYIELMNVSWTPILHSVTIDVYEKITPKAPAPSSNSTGSTNATKKAKAPPPAVQQNTTKSTGNATSAAAPAPTNVGRHPNSAALPVAIGSGVAIAVAIAVAASRRRKPQAAASKGRGSRKGR